MRYCDAQGRDEWRFQDGTVIKTNENGHKILLMPNGQKEIHTKEFKVSFLVISILNSKIIPLSIEAYS